MTGYHRARLLSSTVVVMALAVVPLLAAGCGGSGNSSPSESSSHSSEAGSSGSSDSARETAESRLEEIGPQLAKVLTVFRAGNKQEAATMAKAVSSNLYEGTTEGIVSHIDPAGERQIDPLLASTIPAAISNGESASQVAALIHQGQSLAASCLAAIHKSEASGS
jgi:hypothetical protein